MVGLMDILVHAVDTFDKTAASKKSFQELFDVSTDELTGVRELIKGLLSLS